MSAIGRHLKTDPKRVEQPRGAACVRFKLTAVAPTTVAVGAPPRRARPAALPGGMWLAKRSRRRSPRCGSRRATAAVWGRGGPGGPRGRLSPTFTGRPSANADPRPPPPSKPSASAESGRRPHRGNPAGPELRSAPCHQTSDRPRDPARQELALPYSASGHRGSIGHRQHQVLTRRRLQAFIHVAEEPSKFVAARVFESDVLRITIQRPRCEAWCAIFQHHLSVVLARRRTSRSPASSSLPILC